MLKFMSADITNGAHIEIFLMEELNSFVYFFWEVMRQLGISPLRIISGPSSIALFSAFFTGGQCHGLRLFEVGVLV